MSSRNLNDTDNVKLFLLAYLLRCQRDHLLWSNPLRQAAVWLRDAGAGAPHLHLQPHHHPRPLKVRSQEVLWTMEGKRKYKSSLHGKALSLSRECKDIFFIR